jgi:hypothetical protein|nr:MAG TPA: hypothetical protein [Inoviridae sp.]
MKVLLKKISCLLISCIIFACPIYSNANYHNSLLEVHAEDTTMHYNQWLVLFLASLGLSVTTLAPNPYNWVGDELEKFIKRYKQEEQDRIQNAYIEWQAQMNDLKGQPIVEVPPILYNVFSDFVKFFQTDHGLTSANNVQIGNILTSNFETLSNGQSYHPEVYTVDNTIANISRGKIQNASKPVHCVYSVYNAYDAYTYFMSQASFSNDGFESKYDSDLNIYYLSFSFSAYSKWFRSDYIGKIFKMSSNQPDISLAYKYTFGDQAVLDDKVIGAGDLKLDDRVLETDENATLDLTKVNFGQGVGVDATIADISKWLNGVINGTQDLDWGKVVPIPDVKPIPIPEPTTEPLPTTEPIPTTEPAPTPFPPGEIENYQTPSLTNVFPFCIPYDVVKFFQVLNAEPQAPKWTFDLNNLSEGYKLTIDMKDYDTIIIVFRYGMLGIFIIGLILITRYIVGGQ